MRRPISLSLLLFPLSPSPLFFSHSRTRARARTAQVPEEVYDHPAPYDHDVVDIGGKVGRRRERERERERERGRERPADAAFKMFWAFKCF